MAENAEWGADADHEAGDSQSNLAAFREMGWAGAVPALAGWRRERLAAVPREAFLTLPPDWVCEVLSSSTEAIDRGKKLRIYARERVAHAWLVDPTLRTLEVLSLESDRWTLVAAFEGDARVRAQPFDEAEIELGALWT